MAKKKQVTVGGEDIVSISQTNAEMILGKAPEMMSTKITNCFTPEKIYKVTNLELNNLPTVMNGVMVESFFTYKCQNKRQELQSGAEEITLVNKAGKDMYKIQLVKV